MNHHYSAADKARAEYEYEFGAQDRAEYEGYEQEERRDYNAEAHAIAAEHTTMLPERAHLIALREEIDYFEAQVRDLKRQNQMLRDSHPAFAAVRKPAASEPLLNASHMMNLFGLKEAK